MRTPILLTSLVLLCAPALRAQSSDALWFEGVTSYYSPALDGRPTASGELYDQDELTAAHRTLPFGTELIVLNPKNGRAARVRVNDRGPFVTGRILDLSGAAARAISVVGAGLARVEVAVVPQEPTPGLAPTAPPGIIQRHIQVERSTSKLRRQQRRPGVGREPGR